MTEDRLPDLIYAGTSKAASTWIYQCLYDHPDVLMPESDTVNYFNINYHRGMDWYQKFFSEYDGEAVLGEASTGYLEDRRAYERIAETLPDVKLLFSLRNPIDRAYSHWWHGYSNGYHHYSFENIFDIHPRFLFWIEPGFYATHLERFDKVFSEEQMKVVFFDDLIEDDLEFIQDIFAYAGVDDRYVPHQVGSKSNTAGMGGMSVYRRARKWVRSEAPGWFEDGLKVIWDPVRGLVESTDEYEEGMDQDIRRQLETIYVEDIRRLSERTGRDLDHWLEYEKL